MNQKHTPALNAVYDCQVAQTPQYQAFLDRRLATAANSELTFLEKLADSILRLTGDGLPQFCKDYQWICEAYLKEELYFRRNASYRLTRFQDAVDTVYSKPDIMTPYMNGLVMTQLWWPNHTRAIQFLEDRFLAECPDKYSLLEVGPGHGLLLSFPAADPRCGQLEAWDVSEASISATRQALLNMGVTREIKIAEQNLFEADPAKGLYDAVVFSEVLEHLEEPLLALQKLRSVLKPSGRIYIHMPINSPAPDHLFNLPNPEALLEFVESVGLDPVVSEFVPMIGYSLEKARKHKLTISCLIIAERPATG